MEVVEEEEEKEVEEGVVEEIVGSGVASGCGSGLAFGSVAYQYKLAHQAKKINDQTDGKARGKRNEKKRKGRERKEEI